MVYHSNPSCRLRGKCQPYCGMCGLDKKGVREITHKSLYGMCRLIGDCICGGCYVINGRDKRRIKE